MKQFFKAILDWGKCVVKGFLDNHCSLHAAGLTYFSMLALIPVLCCIVVFAKMAHVDHYAQERLNVQIDGWITSIEKGQDSELAKLTTPQDEETARKKKIAAEEFARQARSFSDQLFGRIAKFDVRKMGWIGFALLLWTVISSLGQVEVCLNEIWDIEKPRPIWKKAYLYIFVATVMPIFAILAMSMPILNVVKDVIVATMGSTWLTKWASDGLIWFIEFWAFKLLISIGFASLAFGYFFWVLPNCKVRWRHAWYGGVLTAVLFGAVMKLCAIAQVGIAKSSALYGSFAFLPIVLAWFYMSWQVILLGGNMVRAFGVAGEGER
ncbi:MAG: YihY/virulence factor BrkB family protein [Kiritimatiellae bacterium]|nr:YihY/virulence factor BrkB family protein [Kiritimatiellia bacterium]MBR2941694.1 YihY/virulence factor BrkB family protein [Kiritimatiellia bacterium]